MAFVSLVSSPPTPVLDKNMTDSEHAGHEREDGELEDGEIDDEGIGIEEEGKEIKVNESKEKEKEKEKDKDDKTHRHSRKRYKKTREKRRSKRRRRDRQKHHSPSSSSSSDSYDSDHERPEKPKNKKSQGSFRDYDGQSAQHGRDSNSGGHSNPQRTAQHKSSDFEKFSDYSDDKYDYEGEGEDFTDDLCEYRQAEESNSPSQGMGRQPKEQMKRPNMKGLQKQQQFSGQRGRGRGVVGRGRGMLNKNKKQKGKNWGRGRGRGGEQTGEGMKQEGKGPPGFQKRRPIMTKEFINQHTVEHNGRYICKYFLEGRCIKGEQCKFEHELVVPDKKKELCKFYIQGYCSKGDNCIYMHNEYPCKFFHTGAKCYQGDSCKFSHKPLTDVTKELLDKIINTEEENAHEDELELENLRKQGIAPLPKPPPGVGLLPTPGPSSPQDGSSGGKKIPSLFEIKVQPTVDLAQKIGLSGSNFSSPPGSQFQGEGPNCMFGGGPEDMQSGTMMPLGPDAPPVPLPGSPGSMGAPPPSHTGTPMRPSPPGQHPSHGFPMPPPVPPGLPPNFHGNRPNMNPQMKLQRPPFPPMPDLQMLQNRTFHAMGQNPVEFLNSFFRNQAIGQGADPSLVFMQESHQQGSTESQMQSLPPAVQRALFLHLNQQHGNEPQGVEGQGAKTTNRVKDENTNWYSSDEEDGNCVTAILKSLKKQNEIFQGQQPQTKPSQPGSAAPGPFDPRLLKDRAPPSDPRMKTDPRQRPTDTRKEPDGTVDPRLVRDPRKVRPMEPHKPPTTEEDEDGEREPRERAALIPLDASPGVMLRDPRCQLKQFSHIRVDILLQRPVFAQTVVWAPEDLIPLLVPKQEHSINLPLPPLVANAQLNRTALPDHPPITTPPHIDPRLAANRLKEGVGRLPPRTLESRSSTERLLASDPRQHKTLDPRISRSGSLDSKFPVLREASSGGGATDPRLQRGNAGSSSHTTSVTSTTRPEPEKLPPYAPHLASSGGGLESPTTLLGGICLYDPRNKAAQAQKDEVEPPKKTGILKQPAKRENTPPSSLSPTQRTGSIQETKGTNSSLDGSSRQTPLSGPTVPSSSPIKPPAVHNLPIQALVGLIRPSYTDPRHPKLVGQDLEGPVEEETEEEPKEEMDDRPLKDVFKTFDPTASPFCQ